MKKIKKQAFEVGLNFNIFIFTIALIVITFLVLIIVAAIVLRNFIIPLSLAIVGVLATIVFISSYQSRIKHFQNLKEENFIVLLTYFKCLLVKGCEPIQCLEKASNYAGLVDKETYISGIDKIKEDASLTNYLALFDEENIEYKKILFTMSKLPKTIKNASELNDFSMCYKQILTSHTSSSKFDFLDDLLTYPVIGMGLTITLLIFMILTSVGILING